MRLLLLLFACSQELPAAPDLTLADDLAAPDLADLALDLHRAPDAFCAGTALAGTCLQPFFEHFADCFQPGGSACVGGTRTAPFQCWAGGAAFFPCVMEWRQNGKSCLMS